MQTVLTAFPASIIAAPTAPAFHADNALAIAIGDMRIGDGWCQ